MDWAEYVETRLKLRDLRILMSVVETGSMSKAAERLGTSQPAISRSVSELEQVVGVRLLDRSSRGIEPTPYGRALFSRALAMFDELKQGAKDINFLSDPSAGDVRVGAPLIVSVSLLSAVINRLSRQYPRLAFQVVGSDTATALQALEQRQVDLVVLHAIEPIDEEKFSVEQLFSEPHVVAVGMPSPLLRRRKTKLADLMAEAWVLPPPASPFGRVVSEAFHAHKLEVPRTVVTSSFPLRSALLATGRYLTMIPHIALKFPAGNVALKRLPIELPSTRRSVAIVTLRNRTLAAATQLFIDCTRKLTLAIQT